MVAPRRLLSAILLMAAVLLPYGAAHAQELTGTWLTDDGAAHVAFAPCDSGQCGHIVWLAEPMSAIDGKPKRDRYNPDASLQYRPIIGLPILTGIQPRPEGGWFAHSYDPKDGGEHDITVEPTQSGKLKLTGCVLGGLFCKSFIWTPVAP